MAADLASMELMGLVGLVLVLYLLIAPLVALVRSGHARQRLDETSEALQRQAGTLAELQEAIDGLREQQRDLARRLQRLEREAEAGLRAAPVPAPPRTPAAEPPRSEAPAPTPVPPPVQPISRPAALRTPPPFELEPLDSAEAAAAPARPPVPPEPPQPPHSPPVPPEPAVAAGLPPTTPVPPRPPRPVPAPSGEWRLPADAMAAAQPSPPAEPVEPSALEQLLARGFQAARDWLFGGNLVAKIGLVILFIGIAFLLRLAAAYVTVPIEVRLAGVAAGAIALLAWGWRIRESRRGIGLPVQGAALAILMLVVFGAFKLWQLLPVLPTFGLLLVLVAFTCLLAVLQDALWLAVFGIVGGFAVPILLSTGGGSHVALFSYYALLNAGVLAIAWKRSWRALNLLGFAFTFIIGTAWGVQRYEPQHYQSAQAFLALFVLFYIAIAILYAWRRAPQLKSYVDGTLVFGVPMVAMGLQFGLVKHIEYGMSFSALALGLLYATVASVLWRMRRESLRLLVESFFALAVVFGTLAIPLAFDGRWTSAAWALEGAGIVWVGLRQRQALAWRFGILVQVGSWLAFLRTLGGLDGVRILQDHVGLGFGLLGVTAVFVALVFRGQARIDPALPAAEQARQRFAGLATLFIGVAVAWLLAGMWVETWFRLQGGQRATMLVLTAIGLVLALQWFGRRQDWAVPEKLGGAVAALAGVTFLVLMGRHMDWDDLPFDPGLTLARLLADGALFGGLLLSGGALVSAFAFRRRAALLPEGAAETLAMRRSAALWWGLAVFWWCGFALNGLAHALAWLSRGQGVEPAWYAVSFRAAYAILLALSAWGWTELALRGRFPGRRQVQLVFWPALTSLAGFLYLVQVAPLLATREGQAFGQAIEAVAPAAWQGLLGGPLPGALLLCLLAWLGVARMARGPSPDRGELDPAERERGVFVWLAALGVCWYALAVDPLALWSARLAGGSTALEPRWWQLGFAEWQLLWYGLSAVGWLRLAAASGVEAVRWLAVPTAVLQAFASAELLATLYDRAQLPHLSTGIALLGLWLAVAWCLRDWLQRGWVIGSTAFRLLHFGRVIAPWAMLLPLVALGAWRWLTGSTPQQWWQLAESGWVVAGAWADYLGAWAAIAGLFLLLRQARRGEWPLWPLQDWYLHTLVPLGAAWAVLLALWWNLRQDGGMAPLPYLPLLNPLDLTTGFVALLCAQVWRDKREHVDAEQRRGLLRGAALLGFLWFNLMLLRSAAMYLGLPYRFEALYGSQFVQAMLSLVWTLSAFLLMRHAVKRLSKPLWMTGAALLAVVVAKLFLVDLSNVGSVARIVSFMGVGGCMLLIGYLAPLPREAGGSDPDLPPAEPRP